MPTNIAYFDGVDFDDFDVSLTGAPGVWSAPPMRYRAVQVPRAGGLTFTDELPEVLERRIGLSALIIASTAAAAETAVQTFKDATTGRRLSLSFGHASDRAFTGVVESFEGNVAFEGQLDGYAGIGLTFLCDDPHAVDTDVLTAYGIASERVPVKVGTGPTFPYIRIVGATSGAVTLTARDHAGTSLGTMILSTTLDANDAYVIETVNGGFAWLHNNAVITSAMSLLTAGYFIPVFDPMHADRANSSWPTLMVSDGTLEVTYARRWR